MSQQTTSYIEWFGLTVLDTKKWPKKGYQKRWWMEKVDSLKLIGKLIFQPSIFRCYVSFREGNSIEVSRMHLAKLQDFTDLPLDRGFFWISATWNGVRNPVTSLLLMVFLNSLTWPEVCHQSAMWLPARLIWGCLQHQATSWGKHHE